MLSQVDRAIGFAAKAHEGQKRKIGPLPYIVHPFGVAMILARLGCDEPIVIAGLLHDVVEDTNKSLDDIREEFGEEVAVIVQGCTELPKRKYEWEERKRDMIAKLRDASLGIKLVAAADKYHNLSHTLYNRRNKRIDLWKHFGRGKNNQAWYYRTVTESLVANVREPEQYPIFEMLRTVVEETFKGIASEEPHS
jgi:(p)ppGpp synthase/HD superfamily hydrolase